MQTWSSYKSIEHAFWTAEEYTRTMDVELIVQHLGWDDSFQLLVCISQRIDFIAEAVAGLQIVCNAERTAEGRALIGQHIMRYAVLAFHSTYNNFMRDATCTWSYLAI